MQAFSCLIFVAALLGVPLPALAQSEDTIRPRPLAQAIAAARRADWQNATQIASKDAPIAQDIVTWLYLRAGQGSLQEFADFLTRYPDWPGRAVMRRRAEEAAIAEGPETVLAFFAESPPETPDGVVAYAEANDSLGEIGEAEASLVLAWHTMNMDIQSQDKLLGQYEALLRPHHAARADMLLWERKPDAAARLRPHLEADQRALLRARLALQSQAGDVSARLEKVPDALKEDAGLARDLFEWHIRAGRWDSAKTLLLERSGALGRPAAWASRRRALARDEMRDGDPQRAYAMAAAHGLSEGAQYADLEWLAGYIALRKLNDPETALRHFQNHQAAVRTPISRGRAAYWIGRAYEAQGDSEAARASYVAGAAYQTSFYGLLAAEKAGLPFDPELRNFAATGDWSSTTLASEPLFQAGLVSQASGELSMAEMFWVHLADRLDATGTAHLGQAALDLEQPHLAVMIAKKAARRGLILPAAYYPLHPLAEAELSMDPALTLAVARRESEFDPNVRSGAGALGLMQLMPGTGRDVAQDLGIGREHNTARLTSDPIYNAWLGATYLAQMAERFGGNPVLMAAAYNAGPARPERWLALYGDPRAPEADIVDWIEHIPFRETRNYVMRVTESLPIYRARLGRDPLPRPFSEELAGASFLAFAPKGE